MKKIVSAILIASLSVPTCGMLGTARADDTGRIVAGAAGGFLGGLFLGGALSHSRPAPPPPTYYAAEPDVGPGPGYDAPPPQCYWRPSRPFWDAYYGVWRRPRVRVCD
jgi:hypothetical protein